MTPARKKEEQQKQQLLLFLDVSHLTGGCTRQNDDQRTDKLARILDGKYDGQSEARISGYVSFCAC